MVEVGADPGADVSGIGVVNHVEDVGVQERLAPVEQVKKVGVFCYLVNQLLEIIEGHLAPRTFEGAPTCGTEGTAQDADVDGINDVVIGVASHLRFSELPMSLRQKPVSQLQLRQPIKSPK